MLSVKDAGNCLEASLHWIDSVVSLLFKISRVEGLAAILILVILTLSTYDVYGQERDLKILDVYYPTEIKETLPFDFLISIENCGNVTETVVVKVTRSLFFSMQKEVIAQRNSVANVTFELRLLLSKDLTVDVFLGSELIDSTSVSLVVPTPEADVGMLMVEMMQTEITFIGVTFAGLAFFASGYLEVRSARSYENAQFLEKLQIKGSNIRRKTRKILESSVFLIENDYGESSERFFEIPLVKRTLSERASLERRKIALSEYQRRKKTTIRMITMLTIAIGYGLAFILATPFLVDSIMFINRLIGARDLALFLFFLPSAALVAIGILSITLDTFMRELGHLKTICLLWVLCFSPIVICVLFGLSATFLLIVAVFSVCGFSFGLYLGFREENTVPFRKERVRITRTREKLDRLCLKNTSHFEKTARAMIEELLKELENFDFVFELISEEMDTKQYNTDVKHALNLLSDKQNQSAQRSIRHIKRTISPLIQEIKEARSVGKQALVRISSSRLMREQKG